MIDCPVCDDCGCAVVRHPELPKGRCANCQDFIVEVMVEGHPSGDGVRYTAEAIVSVPMSELNARCSVAALRGAGYLARYRRYEYKPVGGTMSKNESNL